MSTAFPTAPGKHILFLKSDKKTKAFELVHHNRMDFRNKCVSM